MGRPAEASATENHKYRNMEEKMRSFALHKIMVALLLMVGVVLFAAGVSDSDSGYLVGVGLAAVLLALVS